MKDSSIALLISCAVWIFLLSMIVIIVGIPEFDNEHEHQYLVCVPMSRSTTPVYFDGINASCIGNYCSIDTLKDSKEINGLNAVDLHVTIDRTDMICGISDSGRKIRIK